MRFSLIHASSADEPWLNDLRRRAYADLFNATWGAWDEDRHSRHFAAFMRRGSIFVIVVGGERVGVVQLIDDRDAIEVAELQIDPRHQGRGVGTCVLQDVISRAAAQGLAVRLGVGLKNERAIELYRRLGFDAASQSETHCHMRHAGGDGPHQR